MYLSVNLYLLWIQRTEHQQFTIHVTVMLFVPSLSVTVRISTGCRRHFNHSRTGSQGVPTPEGFVSHTDPPKVSQN